MEPSPRTGRPNGAHIEWRPSEESVAAVVRRALALLERVAPGSSADGIWAILLREAVSNVHRHGRGAPGRRGARLTVKRRPSAVEVRVIDAASPPSAPLPRSRRRTGGLGLLVLRHGAHRLERRVLLGRHLLRMVRPWGSDPALSAQGTGRSRTKHGANRSTPEVRA